jgi:hypothetical protein
MAPRKILLSLLAVFSIITILNITPYKLWFDEKIMSFREDIYDQFDNLDYEYRKEYRLKGPYKMAQSLKTKMLEYDSTLKNVLLLIPPQSYFDIKGVNFLMPEPIMLYAFSGVKAALPTSKNLYKANYGVRVTGIDLYVVELKSKAAIDSLLMEYKAVQL